MIDDIWETIGLGIDAMLELVVVVCFVICLPILVPLWCLGLIVSCVKQDRATRDDCSDSPFR